MFRSLAAAGLIACAAIAQTPQITANGLKADVSFLASDALEGRGTPSRGLDLAAEFIAAQFRRAGLEPAGDDGYFQTAGFESVNLRQDAVTFAVEIGGKTLTAAPGSVSVQRPAAMDLQSATAVFANQTLTIDGGKAEVRIPAGPGRGGRGGGARPQLREAGVAGAPVILVTDPQIRDALAKPEGDIKASIHIPSPDVAPVKLRNVAAILRGSDSQLKDTYLMITGHYDHLGIRDNGTPDHIYNGADDDASGTASVIEIAAALAALPARPKRSIVFVALFGEELGDLGSHYYARHPIFPLAKTVVDVNLEQMGRTDDTSGPRVRMFNLTGYDFTDLPAVFNKAGESTGIKAVKDEQNSDPYFARSDNAAFAQAGVPSTTISVAYSYPDYHQPGDEWEKLDYENMALVDRTIALAILDLANSSQTTKWNEANPKTAAYIKARNAQ
jgi:hypothetical protein